MPNIISYLNWRGDLSFKERFFNDVDNVILSALSYIDFNGIVPEIEKNNKSITIQKAANRYFDSSREVEELHKKRVNIVSDTLLSELADSERFKYAKLSNFIEIYDEENRIQFSALQINLLNGLNYVSYRGTDNSLVGWQEDFTMSYSIVPSQTKALNYLKLVLNKAADNKFMIGGHSKGGNLAMYAAMMCSDEERKKIIAIYNNDGPGFSEHLKLDQHFKEIKHKTFRIIPEFSVVGMLFEGDTPYKIVESNLQGFNQHNLMSWQVFGDSFVEKQEITSQCKKFNLLFDEWINSIEIDKREVFTSDFFKALNTKGTGFVQDITSGGLDNFEDILVSLNQSDKSTKTIIRNFFLTFIKGRNDVDYFKLLKDKNSVRGALFALFGLFFMLMPENALKYTGEIINLFILIYTGFKLAKVLIKVYQKQPIKRISTIIYSFGFAMAGLFLIQNTALIISQHLLLSFILFMESYFYFKEYVERDTIRKNYSGWLLFSGISFLLFGIVTFITLVNVEGYYIFFVGGFLVVAGIIEILNSAYEQINKNR